MDLKNTIKGGLYTAQKNIKSFIASIQEYFKKHARIESQPNEQQPIQQSIVRQNQKVESETQSAINPDPVLFLDNEINGTHTAFGVIPSSTYFKEETNQWHLRFFSGSVHESIKNKTFLSEQDAEAFIESYTLNSVAYSMLTELDESCREDSLVSAMKLQRAIEKGYVTEAEMEKTITDSINLNLVRRSNIRWLDDDFEDTPETESIPTVKTSDELERAAARREIEEENKKYLANADREVNINNIIARRELQVDGDEISFLINGKKHKWLANEEAKAYILSKLTNTQDELNLNFPFCGKRATGRVVASIFGEEHTPQVAPECVQSVQRYISYGHKRINDIMWSGIGDLGTYLENIKQDKNKPQTKEELVDEIGISVHDVLNLSDSMQTTDKDMRLHRRVKESDFAEKIPEFSGFDDNAGEYEIDLNGCTSTSAFKAATQSFSGSMDFVLHIPKGTPMLWVGLLYKVLENSAFTLEENEVLLMPTRWKIQSIQEADDDNSTRIIEFGDPQQLNVYALLLQSLNKIKESNIHSLEIVARIDQIANTVKTKVKEKHGDNIPEECKGAYTSTASQIKPTQPRKNIPLSKIIGLERGGEDDFAEDFRALGDYAYGGYFNLDKVNRRVHYNSTHEDTHNEDHVDRVILNGTLLAAKEQLNKEEFALLLPALKYHDIGRNDITGSRDDSGRYIEGYKDGASPEHGQSSADRIRKLYERGFFKGELETPEDLEIVCAAVVLHSQYDSNLEAIKETNPKVYKIASMLKDADNLDRVRLGDLNPQFLRSPHAADIIPFSERLYQNYRQQRYAVTTREKEN